MNELILHHYRASPFSEKVRLMLGFKGLAWRSVIVPPVMPKPDLTAPSDPSLAPGEARWPTPRSTSTCAR